MTSRKQQVRAVIYARVSQDRDGKMTSVDQQLSECRSFAAERGFSVIAELWDNDISAYTGKPRPKYAELLTMIRDGAADVVIIWEQSRLTRRPYELEGYIDACEPHGVATHSVTSGALDLTTPQGRMVARITGAVNRQEVEQLIGRVKRGLRARAASGQPVGGRRPFGFHADKVTPDPREAAAILQATRDIVAGESVHGIARKWRAEGLLTTTGKTWSTGQIRTLLRRARNAGLRQHAGKVVGRASWDAIVPVDLWTACVAVLDDPSRRSSPGTQPAYLGTFLYRCGALINGMECGVLMRSWRSGRSGVRIYRCSVTDRTTNHVTIPIADADNYVGELIVRQLHGNGFAVPPEGEVVAPTPATDVLAELESRQSTIARQFATGLLPEAAYVEALTLIQAQLEQVQIPVVLVRQVPTESSDLASEQAAWSDLSLDRKRALVAEIATVTILPVGSGVRAPLSKRIRVVLDLSEWHSTSRDTADSARAEREAWGS